MLKKSLEKTSPSKAFISRPIREMIDDETPKIF